MPLIDIVGNEFDMKDFRKIILTLVFTVTCLQLFAQTGTIRGFVYDKTTDEPVIFTNVYLKGTNYGTSTDVNGFYSISKVPVGNYTLMSTSIGYDTASVELALKKNKILNQKLYLSEKTISLDVVNISADKQEAKTEVKVSVTKITLRELKQIPTIGGEADLAQYMQIIPGVIFTGDQGGQLYIRGGSPIQNKVILDGMVIYNPFHSIGLFSVFDSDIIRNVDVYTGGFNAEYGGRISGIMDITTRDGNRNKFAGKFSANPFMSKALFEGPLGNNKNKSGSNAFILSARTSYLEQSSKILYPHVGENGLPYNFLDLYAKTSFRGASGNKLNLFGFNHRDNVNFSSSSNLNWNATGVGTNFVIVPATSMVLIQGYFAYSNFRNSLIESDSRPRYSEIGGFNSTLAFTYFIGQDELKYGIEMLGFETDFEYWTPVGQQVKQNDFTSELATYLKYKKIINKILVEPSFRIHYYSSQGTVSLEPRFGSKYNVTDNFRIKFAGGFYSQNLVSATSDRDVVNLFSGYLSGPSDLPESFDGKLILHNLQKARHLIAGFELNLPKNFDLNIEGYYKYFPQLTNINRNKLFADDDSNADKEDYLKKDFIIETAKAYGTDFLIKYDYKRLYLWVGYSIAYVTRYDGLITYPPHFDRRHNSNFVGSYTFGKDLNWEFGARWNLGSGFPFTKTAGFYPSFNFYNGINTDYTTANENVEVLYGTLNNGRLPYYHRLDCSLKRKFQFSNDATLEAVVSVTNLYNRSNIFFFDRLKYERVDQLPILPTIGLSMKF